MNITVVVFLVWGFDYPSVCNLGGGGEVGVFLVNEILCFDGWPVLGGLYKYVICELTWL